MPVLMKQLPWTKMRQFANMLAGSVWPSFPEK
jgi:hypothetical protein